MVLKESGIFTFWRRERDTGETWQQDLLEIKHDYRAIVFDGVQTERYRSSYYQLSVVYKLIQEGTQTAIFSLANTVGGAVLSCSCITLTLNTVWLKSHQVITVCKFHKILRGVDGRVPSHHIIDYFALQAKKINICFGCNGTHTQPYLEDRLLLLPFVDLTGKTHESNVSIACHDQTNETENMQENKWMKQRERTTLHQRAQEICVCVISSNITQKQSP